MIQQTEFSLSAKRRGFHLVTREILSNLPELPKTGLLNLFVQHTSCALSINENADPKAFRVNDLIEGFQMALCKMHVGDHWEVYIPWQKGYSKRSDADIPGYSTLIFENSSCWNSIIHSYGIL